VVIMRDGRLEQVGTPEEIYSRPASRFVASFIGASNFLRGSIESRSGDRVQVWLASGGQVLMPWPSGPHTEDGRKDVLISVRPEAVSLAGLDDGAPAAQGSTLAKVEQVVYRGQTTHVHMKLDDGEPFVAFLPNRLGERAGPTFAAGDRIRASWPLESNWLVADA
jgi:putative spermidine/putrescine transport system ATP-binding protein